MTLTEFGVSEGASLWLSPGADLGILRPLGQRRFVASCTVRPAIDEPTNTSDCDCNQLSFSRYELETPPDSTYSLQELVS